MTPHTLRRSSSQARSEQDRQSRRQACAARFAARGSVSAGHSAWRYNYSKADLFGFSRAIFLPKDRVNRSKEKVRICRNRKSHHERLLPVVRTFVGVDMRPFDRRGTTRHEHEEQRHTHHRSSRDGHTDCEGHHFQLEPLTARVSISSRPGNRLGSASQSKPRSIDRTRFMPTTIRVAR